MAWYVTLSNLQFWPLTPSARFILTQRHTHSRAARMHCKSGLICQRSVSSLSVDSVWVSDECFECLEMSKCECVSVSVSYGCVRMFDSSWLTGICHYRGFRALSSGSLLISFNSLIVSCGLCRGGALCVCICPISNCFHTHTFKLLLLLQNEGFAVS